MPQEELLRRTFRLVSRNPLLWVLALLAGEGSGGSGFSSSGSSFTGGRGSSDAQAALAAQQLAGLGTWLLANLAWIATLVLALLLVGLVVSCLATGALYRAQTALDAGLPFGTGTALAGAAESFWRVLGLRFLVFAVGLLIYSLLGGFTVFMGMAGGPSALAIAGLIDASFLLFLGLLALVAWPVLTLAGRLVVLEGRAPLAALREGLAMLARRPGRVALTAGISIALGIAVGVVFSIVDTLVAIPFIGPVNDAAATLDLARIWTALVPLLVVLVPVSTALGAVAGSFYSTYWTLSYMALRLESQASSTATTA